MPKPHKRRIQVEKEPLREKRSEAQAAALAALMRERDQLGGARPTRGVTRRREELPGKIDAARVKLARTRRELEKEILAEPTGLVDQHEEIMMTFARANDVVMMWRPINAQAAAKLEGRYQADGQLVGQYKGKALNTKGKSSVYPAISADIPLDVRLSKVPPEDFEKFQEKNNNSMRASEQALENYRNQFAGEQDQHHYEKLPDLVHVANEEKIVVSVNKTDVNGNVIFYVLHDANNSVYRDSGNTPVFIMQKEQGLFCYDPESGRYD